MEYNLTDEKLEPSHALSLHNPMRRTFFIPKLDRLMGLLFALTHAWIVGSSLQSNYAAYYAGLNDPFDFHGFIWMWDFPLRLLIDATLIPYGIVYRRDDIWSYVVKDMILLVACTLYWFAVGFFVVRIVTPTFKRFGKSFGRIQLDNLKTLRIAALLLIFVGLVGKATNVTRYVGQALFLLVVFGLPLLAAIRGLFELSQLIFRVSTHIVPSPPPPGEGGPA